jgi:hypothetical protein
MRVGNHDERLAEGGRLGQGRAAGPPHDEVGRHERIGHLGTQERVRPVAIATTRRERLPGGEGVGITDLAGDVDEVDPLHQLDQRGRDRGVEPPNGL